MAATTVGLPPNVAAVNEKTLADALAATHITKEDEASSPAEEDEGEDLEDGEIREDDEEEDDGKVKTVFDDAERFNVKVSDVVAIAMQGHRSRNIALKPLQHPLYSPWTLYFDSPQSKLLPKTPSSTPASPQIAHGGWMEDIRKIVTFDSVEEFWGTYNNIVPPSLLPGKANYYLFKVGSCPTLGRRR